MAFGIRSRVLRAQISSCRGRTESHGSKEGPGDKPGAGSRVVGRRTAASAGTLCTNNIVSTRIL